MNTKKSLEESVLEEIKKTGYPTEIVRARVLQERGWGILHNPSFWDDEETQSREIDIRAYHSWKSESGVTIGAYLITECKKSEKPWVFFMTPEEHVSSRLGDVIKWRLKNRQIFTDYWHPDSEVTNEQLQRSHHYFQIAYRARTFFEPFKNQDKTDRAQMIYSAIMSTIKATLFHYKEEAVDKWLQIYYPLIVFDGNLFEAHVNQDKSIEIKETHHISLAFNYITSNPSKNGSIWEAQKRFIVDIVKENYLQHYLETIEDEHKLLASKL